MGSHLFREQNMFIPLTGLQHSLFVIRYVCFRIIGIILIIHLMQTSCQIFLGFWACENKNTPLSPLKMGEKLDVKESPQSFLLFAPLIGRLGRSASRTIVFMQLPRKLLD